MRRFFRVRDRLVDLAAWVPLAIGRIPVMATLSTALESLRVGDAVIVDDASPEAAMCRVTKVTRSQIVCGRRRYCKANGMPIRGSRGYGIRPATLEDFYRVARAMSSSASQTPDSEEPQLLGGNGADSETWGFQTIEQLQGMVGWLDAAGG